MSNESYVKAILDGTADKEVIFDRLSDMAMDAMNSISENTSQFNYSSVLKKHGFTQVKPDAPGRPDGLGSVWSHPEHGKIAISYQHGIWDHDKSDNSDAGPKTLDKHLSSLK